MVKILGDITEVGTISGSVGTFSTSLTVSGLPVSVISNIGDFLADGSIPMTGVFKAVDGTNALPGISFDNDQDTGIYRIEGDVLGITTSGNRALVISGTGRAAPQHFRFIQGGGTGTVTEAEISNRNATDSGYAGLVIRGDDLKLEAKEGGTAYLRSNDANGEVIIEAEGTSGDVIISAAQTINIKANEVGVPGTIQLSANQPNGGVIVSATGTGGGIILAANGTSGIFQLQANNSDISVSSQTFVINSPLLTALSGTFTSLISPIISGTSVQIGGALSAQSGAFSNSLTISGVPVSIGGGGGINNVVEDITPQLGGNLDAQTFDITGVGTLEATAVTGTTGQFGGTLSADTGSFKNLTTLVEPFDFGWTAAATGTLVLEQQALYPYTINQLTGQTGQGTVSGTLKVNNAIVGGLSNQTWNTTASTKTATSNNSVVVGDRVSFVVSGTSNGKFVGFTLKTTRV